MRVIAGRWRGRKFPIDPRLDVRPTMGFAKEGLFNYLRGKIFIPQTQVLDLFCGSGNIGIEFLSRGAPYVHFVDHNKNAIRYLKRILKTWKVPPQWYGITQQPVEIFLRHHQHSYDLIFMDPPYRYPRKAPLIRFLMQSTILKEDGWIILEHRLGEFYNNLPGYIETRHYGDSAFSIFQRNG